MRKVIPLLIMVMLFSLSSAGWGITGKYPNYRSPNVTVGPNGEEYVTGEVLVKFKAGTPEDEINRIHSEIGAIVLPTSEYVDFQKVAVPEGKTVPDVVRFYRQNLNVEYAEPNYIARLFFYPNDPKYGNQWGPPCIGAEKCWDQEQGNHSVIVSVLDTGVDYTHPDLNGNVDTNIDYDFVNDDADAKDDFGHGTHCIGIIAAEINNGVGVAGLQQVKIMAVKVVDWLGMGTYEDIIAGINYSVSHGAKVISMSLGGTSYSSALENACNNAYNAGLLLVAAAGNSNSSQKTYPAAFASVVGVAALENCTTRASYSNWGWDNVELSAPGSNVYSTMPTYFVTMNLLGYSMNYDYCSGTSMACPHVAGVGSAYFCYRPTIRNTTVRTHMQRKADDLGSPGNDQYYGYGRVDLYPPDGFSIGD